MGLLDTGELLTSVGEDTTVEGDVPNKHVDLAPLRVVADSVRAVMDVSPEILDKAMAAERFCRDEVAPLVERIVGIGMKQIDQVAERTGKKPKLLVYERDGHVLGSTMIALENKTPGRVPFRRKLVPFSRHTTVWTRHPSRTDDAELLADYVQQLRDSFVEEGDMLVHVDSGLAGSIPTYLSPKFFDDLYNVMWLFATDVEYPEDSRLEILDWRHYGLSERKPNEWLVQCYQGEDNPYPPFNKFRTSPVPQGDVIGSLLGFMEKILTGGSRSSIKGLNVVEGRVRPVFNHYPRGSESRIVKTAAYRGFLAGVRESEFTLDDISPEMVPELMSTLKDKLEIVNRHPLVASISMMDMGLA